MDEGWLEQSAQIAVISWLRAAVARAT